jgi:hypothetical protein
MMPEKLVDAGGRCVTPAAIGDDLMQEIWAPSHARSNAAAQAFSDLNSARLYIVLIHRNLRELDPLGVDGDEFGLPLE